MRISLESLYIDTMLGFEGLNTYSKYSDYITLVVLPGGGTPANFG